MKETAGKIINIGAENQPVTGCTVSKQLYHKNGYDISIFSLAVHTSISAESYTYHKLWIVQDGEMTVFDASGKEYRLEKGESFVTPVNIPVGVKTETGSIYLELGFKEETKMNEVLKAGSVFELKNLLPYQEGKIVNMDLINDPNLKFVVMSFDEGTGLSEHAAPGEALVFALDGEAVIGYEGEQHLIKAGETFKFDKFGRHSVSAVKKFKMALLLVLE